MLCFLWSCVSGMSHVIHTITLLGAWIQQAVLKIGDQRQAMFSIFALFSTPRGIQSKGFMLWLRNKQQKLDYSTALITVLLGFILQVITVSKPFTPANMWFQPSIRSIEADWWKPINLKSSLKEVHISKSLGSFTWPTTSWASSQSSRTAFCCSTKSASWRARISERGVIRHSIGLCQPCPHHPMNSHPRRTSCVDTPRNTCNSPLQR